MTLNISAANLGIAVGALTGGWAVDRFGMAGLGPMPAALTVAALLVLILLRASPLVRGGIAST